LNIAEPGPHLFVLRARQEESIGARMVIAGLTVVERSAKQLSRSGGRVIVVTDGTVKIPAALGRAAEIVEIGGDPDAFARWLMAYPQAIVLDADHFRRASGAANPSASHGFRIVDETTRRQAEDLVFADLLRGDLGFIARHINKKISFRLNRHVLCHLPVTPNQVTVGAGVVGFLGCLLLTTGAYAPMAAGLVLAQAQSILDGCDGELARVRFQQSAIGEWLDTLMDDGLNLALVATLGIGVYRSGWGATALTASVGICAMLVVYNAVSYRELIRQKLGGELLKVRWKINRGRDMKALWASPDGLGAGKKFLLTLGRRDTFIFGWMVLGLLDLAPVILLWAFAVALPSFVVAVGQLVLPKEYLGDPSRR
jgi:phosphatidylglycerophosphate synthase